MVNNTSEPSDERTKVTYWLISNLLFGKYVFFGMKLEFLRTHTHTQTKTGGRTGASGNNINFADFNFINKKKLIRRSRMEWMGKNNTMEFYWGRRRHVRYSKTHPAVKCCLLFVFVFVFSRAFIKVYCTTNFDLNHYLRRLCKYASFAYMNWHLMYFYLYRSPN